MGRRERLRIGISGSYGGFNLGDEAILHAIVGQLRASLDPEITVFSRDAADTRRRHRMERAIQARQVPKKELCAALSALDLFVLGGGGILYDAEADAHLREVEAALEVGTKVMTYAISAGPLTGSRVRERVREALSQASLITVRDGPSQQLLEEIGVRQEIVVTADPALLLQSEPLAVDEALRAEAIDPGTRLIAFSVREPGPAAPDLEVTHYHRLVASAADFLVNRLDAEVLFIPLERRMFDVQHSHGVVAQMRHAERANVLKREYSPGQLVSLLQRFDLTIGMRLHFLIFSALSGVPFVALPYASKVRGFLDDMGFATPELADLSVGQFIAHIDRAWEERDALKTTARAALPALQARARRTHTLLLELLGKPQGPS